MVISRTLGAAIGPGGGVVVLAVEPGMPAAKAGIKPGDVLGRPTDCAASLSHSFAPRKEARTIEWTVHRPTEGAVVHPALKRLTKP